MRRNPTIKLSGFDQAFDLLYLHEMYDGLPRPSKNDLPPTTALESHCTNTRFPRRDVVLIRSERTEFAIPTQHQLPDVSLVREGKARKRVE